MDVSIKTPKFNTEKPPVSPEWQKSQLQTIAECLPEGPNTAVRFFVEDQFKKSDISLKIEGIGRLHFRGRKRNISVRKLMSAAVREIPAESVLVLLNQAELARVLDGVRTGLGLDGDLEARQGAMLIGRCDSPPLEDDEGDDVVGNLVVVLPFPHRGGDLVLHRGTERHAFVSEDAGPDVFKCVGFLADSTSYVRQVREGCFVSLTYKLVLKSKSRTGLYVNPHLICAVADYFDGFQSDDCIENKFVCMLEEHYTEQTLNWHMLRGEDHVTGSALLAVAEALRLVPYLALVEIRHACDRNPCPHHHHAQCVRFLKFVDSNKEPQADTKHIQVKEKEICWKGSTAPWNLPNSEDQYVRYGAAVVMWSSSMSSELRFAFDYRECLVKLRATMKHAGKEKEVAEIVKKYSKFFHSGNMRQDFLLLTEIALYIKDDLLSMCILSRFEWDVLNCGIEEQETESLALLEAQYGTEWCISLLDEWKCKNISVQCDLGCTRSYILQHVDRFVLRYLSCSGTPQVVSYILNQQLSHLYVCSNSFQNSSKKKKLRLVSKFCSACISISGHELMEKLLQYLVSNPSTYTRNFIFTVYWKLKRTISPSDYIFIEPLKGHVASSINSEIDKVKSVKKNRSIKTGLLEDCECKWCKRVNAFLISETAIVMVTTLSWKHHKHLKCRCRGLRIPVSLTVEPVNQEKMKGPMKVRICKQHGKERYLAKLRFCLKQLQ